MNEVRIQPGRVNGYRLMTQGLSPRRHDFRQAALDAGWLPARETSYLALQTRTEGFARSALDDLVFRDGAFVELGTVRGQAYLVPRELVPAALRCPAPSLLESADQMIDRAAVPRAGRPHLADPVRRALAEMPRSLPDLLARVTVDHGAPARFLGMPGVLPAVLTRMRLDGEVARTRLEPPLDRGAPVFALTENAFPDLDVKGLDPRDALRILLAFYFRVHGPATRADFGWWSGAGRTEVAEAFEAHRERLVSITIEGLPFTYWLPPSRCEEMLSHDRPGAEPVVLTPFLDPWLTSHEGRAGRFLRPEDLDRICPGPSLPAILYGGVVAGRWEYDTRAGEIRLEWFRKPGEGVAERAGRAAAETAEFLRREMPDLAPLSVPGPEGPIPVYS